MKNIVIYLIFVFTIVFLFGFAYSLNANSSEGKAIFTNNKCSTCHSVEVQSIECKKKDPVDLSTVGNTYNAEFISKYLIKEVEIDSKLHKIAFKGTEEELKTLSEWLGSLKSEEAEQ